MTSTVTAQDLIALSIALAALLYVARSFWHQVRGKSGCACAGEKRCGSANNPTSRTGLKRLPLVSLEQVGKPAAK